MLNFDKKLSMRFLNTCFVFCFVSEIFATPDTTLVQNYLNDQIDNKNVFGVQISFQQNDFCGTPQQEI